MRVATCREQAPVEKSQLLRAEFLCRAALDEIAEQRGHLAGFFVPLFPRAERLVVVLRKQNMHLALLQQVPEVLAGILADLTPPDDRG